MPLLKVAVDPHTLNVQTDPLVLLSCSLLTNNEH